MKNEETQEIIEALKFIEVTKEGKFTEYTPSEIETSEILHLEYEEPSHIYFS